jgi:hypothetical protein
MSIHGKSDGQLFGRDCQRSVTARQASGVSEHCARGDALYNASSSSVRRLSPQNGLSTERSGSQNVFQDA